MALTIGGVDLESRLQNMPAADYRMENQPVDVTIEVLLSDTDKALAPSNPTGFFSDDWGGWDVVRTYQGQTIIDGKLYGVASRRGQMACTVQGAFQAAFGAPAVCQLSQITPSAAAAYLLGLAGLGEYVDISSFAAAETHYQAGGALIALAINSDDGVSTADALGRLAECGVASCYLDRNRIRWGLWQAPTTSAWLSLEPDMVLGRPSFESQGPEKITNDYAIRYFLGGETPATDANGARYGAATQGQYGIKAWSPNYGNGQSLQVLSPQAAHFLGGQRMLRDRSPRNQLRVKVRPDALPCELDDLYSVNIEEQNGKQYRVVGCRTDGKLANLTLLEA